MKSVFGFRVRLQNTKSYFNDEPIINWLNLLQKRVLWIKTLRSPVSAMPTLCSIFLLSTFFSRLSFFPDFFLAFMFFFPTFFSRLSFFSRLFSRVFFWTCQSLFNSKLKRERNTSSGIEPGTLDPQSAPYPLDHGSITALGIFNLDIHRDNAHNKWKLTKSESVLNPNQCFALITIFSA